MRAWRCVCLPQGETGEVYNIGTEKERTVKEVCTAVAQFQASTVCQLMSKCANLLLSSLFGPFSDCSTPGMHATRQCRHGSGWSCSQHASWLDFLNLTCHELTCVGCACAAGR